MSFAPTNWQAPRRRDRLPSHSVRVPATRGDSCLSRNVLVAFSVLQFGRKGDTQRLGEVVNEATRRRERQDEETGELAFRSDLARVGVENPRRRERHVYRLVPAWRSSGGR